MIILTHVLIWAVEAEVWFSVNIGPVQPSFSVVKGQPLIRISTK